ncbi:hypothetical protein [Lactobacillus kefiranofaciens]|uniref:Integral membrane protein n=1 Tax=Lactobacillus kefiranofaciens TaxID=267818 RepID=A0AAX3UDU7_9LACO|nr:hypothetical protein [Lactobacillus kefiranofaciens]AEG41702.1 hypothetical protein WANG_p1099 [Lactobacillus kefiranofaciens subsp. kefiranofaciens]KRM19899.1 hypothetical protein FC93_GL002027 [Lactobacillus kefiranofaciens subsp. kefiranofaciens DSM 5016 = JCM 6985]QFQ68335.1 hypothetical protein LKK75_08100 [Lactobacillus kefiranofaciens subsp. kefiranofaciens]WGO85874.1 hypothetical protein QEJ78_11320 [Lactobacillus kefiranofaciens]WQH36806.1 hypothetical protein U2870_04135 [Lactobac
MKNNEKAKETIVVILALFLTLLWAWPTISMIKAINLSKVTGQITLVQLIIVIIGFLAYVITSLIYLFFIDYSDENVIRWGITVLSICVITFLMAIFFAPSVLHLVSGNLLN